MATIEVHVPAQQEGTRAAVGRWLKAVGDAVAEHEPLLELETDKVAVEVAAPAGGILAERCAEEGADVEPGALLARIQVEGEPPPPPSAVPLPRVAVEDKAGLSSTVYGRGGGAADGGGGADAAGRADWSGLRLSPAVRRALAAHRLDPRAIAPTGRDGRLALGDVEGAAAAPPPSAAPTPPPQAGEGKSKAALSREAGEVPRRGGGGLAARTHIVPHTPMRRRIAERMAHSVATAPHVTAVFEADFTAIAAHRARHRAAYEVRGVPLTYTAYLVAAAAHAMRAQPSVNAHWGEDALTLHADINVGVGTALGESGLVVPVVHHAQTLSLEGIAARLADTTARARTGKLTPADVADGTFTISNHGVSGSLFASPIILVPPQVAILGVGKLEKRVFVRTIDGADAIQIRPMAYVSLTIDHRALDGAATNAWLTAFVVALEGWDAATP